MNWNSWPGLTTVSLMRFAGTRMFAPLPLRIGLGMKCVVQVASNVILGGTDGELLGVGVGVALDEGVGVGVDGAAVGAGVGVAVGAGVGEALGVGVGEG